ncbi:unnamed protein product [Linum tenue]|uniref:Uncharacterized protein n=1 Tax=Linum tenue TaxID=586396 RepID=A0AAV0LTQ2_9ROSI|nr:unnamed protein product [Linum tenue]
MDQILFNQYGAAGTVSEVEKILGYVFNDKELLVDALTHSSSIPSPRNYQRLEFVGDAVIQLAVSNYLFLQSPPLDPRNLTLLRAANVSTEKLARVAVRRGFYKFVRRNSAALDDRIFRGILEPIVTLEHLERQPQPVTRLFDLCQKQGKHVDIKYWRSGTKTVASIFVDGSFVVSDSSDYKEIAKLDACRKAFDIVVSELPSTDSSTLAAGSSGYDGSTLTIQDPKQKLNEMCIKKKWPKPCYCIMIEEGRPHEKIYVSAVEVTTPDGMLYIPGDAKSRVKDAETSAATFMLHVLQHSKIS